MEQGLKQPGEQEFSELLEISQGQSDLSDLAKVLGKMKHMLLLPPSKKLLQEMQALAAAMGVPAEQAFMPDLHGTIHQNNFYPCVFTHGKFLYHIAQVNNFVEEGEELQTQVMPWPTGLHSFLGRGYGGVIIDGGQPHKLSLNREQLARLVALTTIGWLAALPELGVVAIDGKVFCAEGRDGKPNHFVYDSEHACQYGLASLRSQVPSANKCVAEVIPAADFLKQALGNMFDLLIVNFGCPDERVYQFLDFSSLFISDSA